MIKQLPKRNLLASIAMLVLLTIGCGKDKIEKPEDKKALAQSICAIGEGFDPAAVQYSDSFYWSPSFYLSPSGIYSSRKNSVMISFSFGGVKDLHFPYCDVVQLGIVYTTDGSEPDINNPQAKKIILKGAENFEIFSFQQGSAEGKYKADFLFSNNKEANKKLVTFNASYDAGTSPERPDIYGISTAYLPAIEGYSMIKTDVYSSVIGSKMPGSSATISSLGIYGFKLTGILGRSELDKILKQGYKYRGYLLSLKDDDVAYTRTYDGATPPPPPPATAALSLSPVQNAPAVAVKGTITQKKAVNGLAYTTSAQAAEKLVTNGDISGSEWTKVFVADGELQQDPKDASTHHFSKTLTLKNRITYYIVAFSSEDQTLAKVKTTISIPQRTEIMAPTPIVDSLEHRIADEWSMLVKAEIIHEGTSAVTNYGFEYSLPAKNTGKPKAATRVFNMADVHKQGNIFSVAVQDSILYYPGEHSVKAFAVNASGKVYTETQTFTLIGLPAVRVNASWVSGNSALLSATVIHNGGAEIRSFKFNLIGPNNEPIETASKVTTNTQGYGLSLENLQPGTYSYQPTANNGKYTGYGEWRTFTIN